MEMKGDSFSPPPYPNELDHIVRMSNMTPEEQAKEEEEYERQVDAYWDYEREYSGRRAKERAAARNQP